MLTIKQVAERLGIGAATVSRLITLGDLKAVDQSPSNSKHRMIRVSEEALRDFEHNRGLVRPSAAALDMTNVKQWI